MLSTKALARIGGVLYLAVGVLGAFSEYVRTSATVSGDAAATAANVSAHATLFHAGIVSDLIDFTCFLGVGLVMYAILKPVSPGAALAMLVINAVSIPIQALNMLNQAGALLAATDPSYGAGPTTVMWLLEMHRQGYLIAQIFFGLYLLPLGYLVYRSGLFPKILGVVLAAGAAGYVGGVAAAFASPGFQSGVALYFGIAGGVAELAFLLWLLVMGASVPTSDRTLRVGAVGESA